MEGKKPNIVFKNEPKMSEHEVQGRMNEMRLNLAPQVRDFIGSHPRFQGKEVGITFSYKGVSSLVCIIEAPGEKSVLKLRLSTRSNDEALFLETWEKAGVKVPHVMETGAISGHDYILMEYIDAPVLAEAVKGQMPIDKDINFEMGKTLSAMHAPQAKTYTDGMDREAGYSTFADWIKSEGVKKTIKYVKDNNLLGEEHGSIDVAIRLLTEHADRENKSSYCHGDFGTHNIFYTDPLTVFDPNPMFNNRYIDLGLSAVLLIARKGEFPEQFVAGYFNNEPYDKKILQASILLNACKKFTYWNKTKRTEGIQNVQNYLAKTMHLLD